MGETDEFDAIDAASELEEVLGKEYDEATSKELIQSLKGDIENLTAVLTQKDELIGQLRAKIREQDNEIERIKERVQHEAELRVKREVASVLNQILDVGDDLGRAIAAAYEMEHNPAVVEGVELVRQEFGKTFEKMGVRHLPSLGTRFDPALHDAVSMVPVQSDEEDGVILGVVREGYMLHDEVLREARVAVGKKSA